MNRAKFIEYGNILSNVGALRDDLTIDYKIIVQQARSYTKRMMKEQKKPDTFWTYRKFFRERCAELVERCKSRSSYIEWVEAKETESAKSDLHKRCVDLASAIECEKMRTRTNFDRLREMESALRDAERERDAA